MNASMSAGACSCPEIPEIVSPIAAPVRCACCGGDLEIVCPNRCATEHVDAAMDAARSELRRMTPALTARPDRKPETRPRRFEPKRCAGCPAMFTPTGGRDTLCHACKARRAAAA